MDNSIMSKINKALDESINRCFHWGLSEENNKAILKIWGWQIEITIPMVDAANNQRGRKKQSNNTILLLECITELLHANFEIKYSVGDKQVRVLSDTSSFDVQIKSELARCFKTCRQVLDSLRNPIVVVNDSPRSGKTLFVKWYLSARRRAQNNTKIWWLDFNGGYSDIRYFLSSFLSMPLGENNYIVLDNLECCGFVESQRLLRFFIAFINRLNSLYTQQLKLYIIQDNTKEIYLSYSDFQDVFVYDSSLLEKYDKHDCYEVFAGSSFEKVSSDIDTFLSNNHDKQTLTLFAKFVIFSKNGVNISSKEKAHFLKSIGIRVSKNGEIISFSSNLAAKILSKYSEQIKQIIGSSAVSSYAQDFLSCYYMYLDAESIPITFNSVKQILANTGKSSLCIDNLKNVLNNSEKLAYDLADLINQSQSNLQFGNHLGAMLFAAEAMALFSSSDWKTLHAWNKLRDYVTMFYYVDSQPERLPEIAQAYKDSEGTYKDFVGTVFNGKHHHDSENCINNQVLLQNELFDSSSSYGFSNINQSDINALKNENGYIEDHLYDLFLSPVQIEDRFLNIDRFFQTYLLALLFEFEVTAPIELRKPDRIETLLEKIKYNICRVDNTCAFFYPKRIPWVSARMLLALCYYRNHFNVKDDSTLSREIENIIRSVAKYLISCSITYSQDGTTYRFWAAGAGLWNSALETSIMCTFAVREAASYAYTKEIEEGRLFILHYSDRWFEKKLFADGLWAYRVLNLYSLEKDSFSDLLQDFSNKTKMLPAITNSSTEKNDKSLGYSHIVKTYLELAYDYINCRPTFNDLAGTQPKDDIPNNNVEGETNMKKNVSIPTYKIAITFTGKYRDSVVRPVCEALLSRGFTKDDIFFDEWHEEKINGPHGNIVLQQIYERCDCDVVLLSPDYNKKTWTRNVEWPAILERIITGNGGKICLLSVDGLNIRDTSGLFPTQAVAKVIDNLSSEDIADFIVRTELWTLISFQKWLIVL